MSVNFTAERCDFCGKPAGNPGAFYWSKVTLPSETEKMICPRCLKVKEEVNG